MKKTLLIILALLGIIILALTLILVNRKFAENEAKKPNLEYEYILAKEMYGTDVVTIINKAINNNEKYKIVKNQQGEYENDNKYCIKIELLFKDVEQTYSMEQINNVRHRRIHAEHLIYQNLSVHQ